jgi:hypothetical protein
MEPPCLVFLHIIKSIGHSATELEINGSLTKPTPALKRARGDAPTASQFHLVQMPYCHRALLQTAEKICEEYGTSAGRNWGGPREETREGLSLLE